mgnify:CR=1 FL=1
MLNTSDRSFTNNNIWIMNHYANMPGEGPSLRHFYFAKWLKVYGWNPTIFASNVSHFNKNEVAIVDGRYTYKKESSEKIPFVYVKTSPYSGNGFSRVRNMLSFFKNLLRISKPFARIYGNPDVILASSVHPLTCVAGILIARKFSVPCIVEIRDLWPEAIFSYGKLKKESVIGKILLCGEKWIYKYADAIIFTKEGDVDYIKEMGWNKGHGGSIDLNKCFYINNGVDLEKFAHDVKENTLNDNDFLNENSFKVVYAGAIRPVNNVDLILDAAKIVLKNEPDIKFFIYGDGIDRERLEERAQAEGIANVVFKGYVDKKYIPYILSKASVNILNYSQAKFNWARGNSSNKLFEYMASGKPIISTVKMGYCILAKYRCGFSIKKNDAESLAAGILKVKNMPQTEYEQMGINAALGAKDFDFPQLTKKLVDVIDYVESKCK